MGVGPTGGYDGPEKEDPQEVYWTVHRLPPSLHTGILAQVVAQDSKGRRILGVLQCRSEKDFNWIKSRLEGLQS